MNIKTELKTNHIDIAILNWKKKSRSHFLIRKQACLFTKSSIGSMRVHNTCERLSIAAHLNILSKATDLFMSDI